MPRSAVYDKLVDHFFLTGELGHHRPDNYSIRLYCIENKPSIIKRIKQDIAKITTRCKVIVLSPEDEYTNISILDIEL